VHVPGSLQIAHSHFLTEPPEVSPEELERVRIAPISHDLLTEVTTPHIASPDGIHFKARPEVLGRTYMRVFPYGGYTYAISMPGQLYRSSHPLGGFEEGPLLFNSNMRHSAVLVRDDTLFVFWTQVGTVPELIQVSTIDMSGDWRGWTEGDPVELLRPDHDWEGADAPLEPSVRSTAYGHVNQLRDPAIFQDEGRTFLLYAVAGESGIAIAEVHVDD